jgi:hypothetical protein
MLLMRQCRERAGRFGEPIQLHEAAFEGSIERRRRSGEIGAVQALASPRLVVT